MDSLAALFMGISLFGVYLSARVLGANVLKPFVIATAIVSLSIIIFGLFVTPGHITGGLITNYCASAGFIIIGFFASHGKWQKYLIILVGLGLFFTGAAEALFAVALLALIVLLRKDFGKRLVLVLVFIVILCSMWFMFGKGMTLYMEAGDNIVALGNVITGDVDNYGGYDSAINVALTNRWEILEGAWQRFNFWGNGYSMFKYDATTVHNVPLIIVDHLVLPD
jgi:hypothetical protein